jgi:hypothetical protein
VDSTQRFAKRAILLALLALVAAPATTRACTCTEPPSFRQAYVQSQAIFRGTVTGIRSAATYYAQIWVTLQVDHRWKGEVPAAVEILTGENEASCGFAFAVDSEYLVYALPYGEELSTDLCWRTHLLSPGDPDLILLEAEAAVPRAWALVKSLYR